MSSSIRPITRMAHLWRSYRHLPICHRCLSTASSTDASPSTIVDRTRPLRSPYRILHEPTYERTKKIKTYAPPPSFAKKFTDPIADFNTTQLRALDPTGARTRLFREDNADRPRVGDIVHCVFRSGNPFNGVILAMRANAANPIDNSLLLRNELEQIGVEMSVKIYSPNLRAIEVVRRAKQWMRRGKGPRRARLYYLRQKRHVLPNVESDVRAYLRRRRTLMGRGLGEGDVGEKAGGGLGGKRKAGKR